MPIICNATEMQAMSISERTNNIQQKIDQLVREGGGELQFINGTFKIGSIRLGSNLTLKVAAGAELSFSDDILKYPEVISRWEGKETWMYRACLYAKNAKNLKITGDGVINGNGQKWWQRFKDQEKHLKYARPYLCSVEDSKNVEISDLRFVNSPSWTIRPLKCDGILIQNVKVKNPRNSPNTDGLDPESCNNMRITGCVFDVGDDCIAIKSGTEDAEKRIPCSNVLVNSCNMIHGHGGVVFGSEMSGDITNVVVSNCTFKDTDRGIRFKTRRGRGGAIKDVVVNNIVMDNVLCPLVINSYYFCGERGQEEYVWTKAKLPVNQQTPIIDNLMISNIIAKNVRSCAMFVYGLPEKPIKNLMVSDVILKLAGGIAPEEPAMIADAPKYSHKGVFIENTENTVFKNVVVENADSFFVNDENNLNFLTN